LVHNCDYIEGTRCERMEWLEETHLCKRWKLESQYSQGTSATVPMLWSVPIEMLQEYVYIVNNDHGLSKSWHGSKFVCEMFDQHTEAKPGLMHL
jgi:hypothetical protein